ncbi:sulfurtransferase [Microbacterium gilvum]|uniref:Sulfurtransferase n=1 Tax=Microbacterium gilvum TaxID=1336204 RepID=A0ABP9AQ74_9MICO
MTNEESPARTVVSAAWLKSHLSDPDLVIVDASVTSNPRAEGGISWGSGRPNFAVNHIAGAVFADLLEDFSDTKSDLHFTRPGSAQFERSARALGVSNDSTVIVYDAGNSTFAARLWWLFRLNGHDDVAILDGGLRGWVAAGGRTASTTKPVTPGTFTADPRAHLEITRDELKRELAANTASAIISALPAESAADAAFRARPGRIPGTTTVPAVMLTTEEGFLLPRPDLAAAFAGIDLDASIVTYCGGGIAASLDTLALTHLGAREVRLYDGSLNEWARDPDAPLVSTLG